MAYFVVSSVERLCIRISGIFCAEECCMDFVVKGVEWLFGRIHGIFCGEEFVVPVRKNA